MSQGTLLAVAILLAIAYVAVNVVQMVWVARRTNPDHGPRKRDDWEDTSVADLAPGDVVLSSTLSPGPETVVAATRVHDGAVDLEFRSGRRRRAPAQLRVRRHTPEPGSAPRRRRPPS